MKLTVPIFFGVAIAAALLAIAQAGPASAQLSASTPHEAAERALRERYEVFLREADTAALAWKAEHGGGNVFAVEPNLDQGDSANAACPQGTQFWRRDRIAELCAVTCTSDADCGPHEGRCRIIDFADRSKILETVLVDDLSGEEVDAWLQPTDAEQPPLMLCDPFFDIAGATDADLIAP